MVLTKNYETVYICWSNAEENCGLLHSVLAYKMIFAVLDWQITHFRKWLQLFMNNCKQVIAKFTADTDEDIQHHQTNDCNCKLHPAICTHTQIITTYCTGLSLSLSLSVSLSLSLSGARHEDVQLHPTSRRHAGLSIARRLAVVRPKLSGRRSSSTILS